MYSPIATTHPSIDTATWTKVTTLEGKNRRFLMLVNESASTFRVETVAPDDAAPTLATDGFRLAAGEVYQEIDESTRTSGHVWVYQASGGTLTTLSVKEGR